MKNEVVLITGGSSGIGLAAAAQFRDRGARVWITARNEEKLSRAADTLGGSVRYLASDVTDVASLEALARVIAKEEGRIDVVVNSAGQLELGPAAETVAMAERLMAVNYLGVLKTVAATLPLVRAGSRKSIVILSSFSGRLAPPYFAAYSATKYALQAYASSLRQELRREKIHVGLVLPGPVDSPMTENLLRSPMFPVPFGVPVITVDRAAGAIVDCVLERKAELPVPGYFHSMLRLGSAFPGVVDLMYRRYLR
jgi:NAD(P)-dependent dehydrogenase (short-subunit alcohol dehydrogenase family)